jgi:hypothetical protein
VLLEWIASSEVAGKEMVNGDEVFGLGSGCGGGWGSERDGA